MPPKIPGPLKKFDKKQARMGMDVEKEHQDVTHGDIQMTAKIAASHLKEDPKYYTKLKKIEEGFPKFESTYQQIISEIKCWKGYKKKGTKQKRGKTVNNCVKESTDDTLARIWEVYNKLKGRVSSSNAVEFPQLYEHLHMPWPEVIPALKYISETNWNGLYLEPHERPKSISAEEQPFLVGNYFYLNSF